ncbi:MAG: hypothetical protein KGQ60_02210 [Planctomycetes bacterium]|nr:hypothetical protein [Planctomycetota bacterium]
MNRTTFQLNAMRRMFPLLWLGIWNGNSLLAQTMNSVSNGPVESKVVRFESVQPVLRKHCSSCHNDNQPRGDFSVASLEKILAGSGSGPAVVPGNLSDSPLYLLTAHLENPKMPPNKPRIPQRELQLIERWIATGLLEETKSEGKTMPSLAREMVPTEDPINESLVDVTPFPRASPIRAIAAHPQQPLVAIAGVEQVLLFDSQNQQFQSKAIPVGARQISQLAFSPDGSILMIAVGIPADSGTILRWSLTDHRFFSEVGKEGDLFQCIAASKDGKWIAAGTTGRKLQVYATESGSIKHEMTKHTDWVTAVSWSPDQLLIASGDRFGTIHLWESETGAEFATLRGHTSAITKLLWSTDGDSLYSSSWDGTIRAWDLHRKEIEKVLVSQTKGILDAVVLQGSSPLRIGFGDREGKVQIWNDAERNIAPIGEVADEALAIAWLTDGISNRLLVSNASGQLYQMDPAGDLESTKTQLDLPRKSQPRTFVVHKPSRLKRMETIESGVTTQKDSPSVKDLVPENSLQDSLLSSEGTARPYADIEESRRALQSIESSLQRAYATVSELEETAARVRQLIAIQEARIKQAELNKRKKDR